MFLKARKLLKPIRAYVSYLSLQEAKTYLQISKEVNDSKHCTPRLFDQSTHQTISQGAEIMKNDGFVIVNEAIKEL